MTDRVVLAVKNPRIMAAFQWSGREPAGLDELAFAEALGAIFEGDEMVTYDLAAFNHAFEHYDDEYLTDPD
jgi:hypothetical protein